LEEYQLIMKEALALFKV